METNIKTHTNPIKYSTANLFGLLLFVLFSVTSFNLFAQNDEDKTCVDCHKRTVKKDILHGPTATDCTICHISNGQKHPLEDVEGFTLLEEGAALCFSCHEDAGEKFTTDKYVHPPVERGECTECHEVHSSNDSKLIFAKQPDLCYFCHSEVEEAVEEAKVVHLPITKDGSCATCHSPHSSAHKKILLKNEKALCLGCHDKTIKGEKREIPNIAKQIKESLYKHEPVEEGCSVCHNPHASKNSYLLNESYPFKNYAEGLEANYELCFGCHDTDLLLLEKTKYATEFRNGDRNLHYVHVNKKKGRSCKNCHSIHGAPNEHLINDKNKFGNWEMPVEYTVIENGGTCVNGCHKKYTYLR